jgi:hypothetical protein
VDSILNLTSQSDYGGTVTDMFDRKMKAFIAAVQKKVQDLSNAGSKLRVML